MNILGLVLLVSGWAIVLAALDLLHGNALPLFIVSGLAVEILGLALVVRTHLLAQEEPE